MQLWRVNDTYYFLLLTKIKLETFHNMDLRTCRSVQLNMFGIILFCFCSVRNLKSCHLFYFSMFVWITRMHFLFVYRQAPGFFVFFLYRYRIVFISVLDPGSVGSSPFSVNGFLLPPFFLTWILPLSDPKQQIYLLNALLLEARNQLSCRLLIKFGTWYCSVLPFKDVRVNNPDFWIRNISPVSRTLFFIRSSFRCRTCRIFRWLIGTVTVQ
jgi:hypothetical protein